MFTALMVTMPFIPLLAVLTPWAVDGMRSTPVPAEERKRLRDVHITELEWDCQMTGAKPVNRMPKASVPPGVLIK